MSKNNYQDWTKKDFIKEIERLKKRKKYGLVWEEKEEEVVEMCKDKSPVLKEVKKREIITDKNKPINLLIEGDNYHSLSVLNYTHAKKVDVIYIDPPYNTGAKDWKYNNYYVDREDSFRHSKYIAFLNRRFNLAKGLLANRGIIVCTVDDYEIQNVRHLMDDIFGEDNRLSTVVVVHNPRGRNDDKYIATMHEYMLIYAKNKKFAEVKYFSLSEEEISKYNKSDEISAYNETSFRRTGNNSRREERPNLFYPIYYDEKNSILQLEPRKGTIKILPINGKGEERTWRWGKDTFLEKHKTELFVRKVKGEYRIFKKRRIANIKGGKPKTVWADSKYDASSNGIILLQNIFGGANPFPYPKSLFTVKDIIYLISYPDSIILDYFAGSGTTGHAVLELNKEDNGNRKFILCTDNENKIADEICYPRIKRVIDGYTDLRGKKVEGLGGNLKYFKTDFVDADPTDKNKKKLTEDATEMLCIKEETFKPVLNRKKFKIFKNTGHYTGIIFDQLAIPQFKKTIKDFKGKFSVYVFSLGDDTFEEEFTDVKQKVKLSPIPETILRVYRRIFR